MVIFVVLYKLRTMLNHLLFLFFIINIICVCVCGANTNELMSIQKTLALEVLRSQTHNSVVSVLPLQAALCKLASVAKGKVKYELLRALGFNNDTKVDKFYRDIRDIIGHTKLMDLTEVTKIYVNYTDDVDPGFIANSSVQYGVKVEKVSFNYPKAASVYINRGISLATLRRIEDILQPKDFNNKTSLIIITGAHFKPTWETQFDFRYTKNRKFYLQDNKVKVIPMMARGDTFLHFDAKDFRVLSLKLGCYGSSMTFVLPTYINLTRFLEKQRSDPELLTRIKNQMVRDEFMLVMPRLKIKNTFDMTEYLRKVGLNEIFNSSAAGFRDILKHDANTPPMFISKVKQKLFFELDEFGVTRTNKDWPQQLPQERYHPSMPEFALDKPYYFTVNVGDSEINSIELFNGVVYEP